MTSLEFILKSLSDTERHLAQGLTTFCPDCSAFEEVPQNFIGVISNLILLVDIYKTHIMSMEEIFPQVSGLEVNWELFPSDLQSDGGGSTAGSSEPLS